MKTIRPIRLAAWLILVAMGLGQGQALCAQEPPPAPPPARADAPAAQNVSAPARAVAINGAVAADEWAGAPEISVDTPGTPTTVTVAHDGAVLLIGVQRRSIEDVSRLTFDIRAAGRAFTLTCHPDDLTQPIIAATRTAGDPAATTPIDVPPIQIGMANPDGHFSFELAIDLMAALELDGLPTELTVAASITVLKAGGVARSAVAGKSVELTLSDAEAPMAGQYKFTSIAKLMEADAKAREGYVRAVDLIARQQLPPALRELQEIGASAPRRVVALRLGSSVAEKMELRSAALGMIQHAVKVRRYSPELTARLIKLYYACGRYEQALKTMEYLPPAEAQSLRYRILTVRCLVGMERFDEAIRLLEAYEKMAAGDTNSAGAPGSGKKASNAAATDRADTGEDADDTFPRDKLAGIREELAVTRAMRTAAQQEIERRQRDAAAKLPRVRVRTEEGEFMIELFPVDAPASVANFLKLVDSGYYVGHAFYGFKAGILNRTGDPNTKGRDTSIIGKGGPGYSIEHEASPRYALRGAVAMDVEGDRSAGSRLVITLTPMARLAETHTVFGRVVEGMDAVGLASPATRIQAVERVGAQK